MPGRVGRGPFAAGRGPFAAGRAAAPRILSGQGRLAAINDARVGRDHAALLAAIAPHAGRRFSPSGRPPIGARRTWRLHLALVNALRPLAPMLDEQDLQREADQDLTAFLDEMNDQEDEQEVLAGGAWRLLGEWQFQPTWYHTIPVRVGAYHYGVVYHDDAHPALEDALGLLVNRHIASYGHKDLVDESGRGLDARLADALPQPLGEALYAMIDPPPEEPRRTTLGGVGGGGPIDPYRRYVVAVDAWSARFDPRAAGVVRALAGEDVRVGPVLPDLALFARWVAFDAALAGEFAARPPHDTRSGTDKRPDVPGAGEDNPYLLDPDETSPWDIDYDWDDVSLRALLAHAERARHLYGRVRDVRAALGGDGDPALREGVARTLLAALAHVDAGLETAAVGQGRMRVSS